MCTQLYLYVMYFLLQGGEEEKEEREEGEKREEGVSLIFILC